MKKKNKKKQMRANIIFAMEESYAFAPYREPDRTNPNFSPEEYDAQIAYRMINEKKKGECPLGRHVNQSELERLTPYDVVNGMVFPRNLNAKGSIDWHLFHSESNGLKESGAIITRIPGHIFFNANTYFTWLATQERMPGLEE